MTQPLFPALEAFILRAAPAHVAVDHAPENLAELNAWAAGRSSLDEPLPVWNGASETSIYSSPEVNFAYRAWHDWTHLQLQADIDQAGEYQVSLHHLRDAAHAGVPADELAALWADSHGQNEYYARHGDFVVDQRAFVLAYIEDREAALARTW